jgi:hypothetical protein
VFPPPFSFELLLGRLRTDFAAILLTATNSEEIGSRTLRISTTGCKVCLGHEELKNSLKDTGCWQRRIACVLEESLVLCEKITPPQQKQSVLFTPQIRLSPDSYKLFSISPQL